VPIRLFDLIRGADGKGADKKPDGYSRALQAARVRAAHERSYFAPALFNLVPVETDLIGSMAVDAQWRLYYNEGWIANHSVEENASLLIHEVSHLLRDHERRRTAAGVKDARRWNTAGDCEINDDLHAEGLPLPGDPPLPEKFGLPRGGDAEGYYKQLPAPPRGRKPAAAEGPDRVADCGSGAHGERRSWELPADDGADNSIPGVDRIKAELVRREVARRIEEKSPYDGDVPMPWRRWARATLAPKVDYMATIRHVVRRALHDSTIGRYDRTYSRPHRRQGAYGEFIMASFHQPRPRPGFLIDTSGSMNDTQLSRAVTELGSLTRQLGYGSGDVVVACCDAAVHQVRNAFAGSQLELYGGGGTDLAVGLRAFVDRKAAPIDLLVVVSDCRTPWPPEAPPFPVVTIRVGDGAPPPWGARGANKVITIEEPAAAASLEDLKRAWWKKRK
jgi:predicted metal-dependent peptidase